jgi:hypothetical protein
VRGVVVSCSEAPLKKNFTYKNNNTLQRQSVSQSFEGRETLLFYFRPDVFHFLKDSWKKRKRAEREFEHYIVGVVVL